MRVHSQRGHKSELINLVFNLDLPASSRIAVGEGAIGETSRLLTQGRLGKNIVVLCQHGTMKSLGEPLTAQLSESFNCRLVEMPDGEEAKTPDKLVEMWAAFQSMQLQRNDCVLAVGGGALTDAAGFAAATYLRGVNLILVPSTLLAQVDAAIGGKTGINLPSGKNLAGSFYFPSLVVVDPETLETLPQREMRSGLGEIVKYALIESSIAGNADYRIGPKSLLSVLESVLSTQSFTAESADLTGIITACIKMKLAVVARDPYEQGLRRSLNLGHTLGHAIEKVMDYCVTHGEAVAIGTVFAFTVSERLGKVSRTDRDRVVGLIKSAHLPTELPGGISKEGLIDAMAFDKKRHGSEIKFILPSGTLGNVEFNAAISVDTLRDAL